MSSSECRQGKGKMKEQESISEIKRKLQEAQQDKLPDLLSAYENDGRKGVQTAIVQAKRRMEKLEEEKQRIEQMKFYEKKYDTYDAICGIDEAGRGPLAGPVVAGAVILPRDCRILYLNDSKKLSERKREELYDVIMEQAVAVGVGIVGPQVIDEINILQATYEAMRQAIQKLSIAPDILLNDAVTIPDMYIPQVPIIKGDAKSISIAAASIIAKVTRDRMMLEYDRLMPEYGFASHKGYGSKQHQEAIRQHGASPIHRRTFIKNII